MTNGNGALEGTVSSYNTTWDASIYPVSNAAPREFDGPQNTTNSIALSGTSYSYNGDQVCHDGYTSGVICGIQVDNDDVWTTLGAARYAAFDARGVWGHQVNGSIAVRNGDSGGLVFSVNGDTRVVRGIVSADYQGNSNRMFWTEANDIYKAFGVHLAS
ncbi:hypothetical protein [Kitasatospora phosalacinea]|uniref:Uncharacterized protein n=1 Tax=Kitasatospora phosalacinea TaxID=2065 RepID=A0A9W6PR75_9ACTN|nr:hypothetical protein [Kitasatospora phosalacinea]GLW59646.1 hypothetical protein Kpho01_76560 [Kitasatospora phosalacinea]